VRSAGCASVTASTVSLRLRPTAAPPTTSTAAPSLSALSGLRLDDLSAAAPDGSAAAPHFVDGRALQMRLYAGGASTAAAPNGQRHEPIVT